MNYIYATIVCGLFWFFFGLLLIATKKATGPEAIGAAMAWLVAPIGLGLIPYAIADALRKLFGWRRYMQIVVVFVIIFAICMLAYSPNASSKSYSIATVLYYSAGYFAFTIPFGLPLLFRYYVHYLNESNRLPTNTTLKIMLKEWWIKTNSNHTSEGIRQSADGPSKPTM